MTEEHDGHDDAKAIKDLHSRLRREFRQGSGGDWDQLWQNHLSNQSVLTDYAIRMKRLAQGKWHQRVIKSLGNKQLQEPDRIAWIKTHLKAYFEEDDWKRFERRLNIKSGLGTFEHFNSDFPKSLLDVGSCFAPFHDLDPGRYKTLSIDIAPALEIVKKCDFLKVKIEDKNERIVDDDEAGSEIRCFPAETFDAVIFCLLLEYLPIPEMRHKICQKAYEILKYNGTLFIVTPDSCHQARNLRMIKSWKVALTHMGFFRIYYEKLQHLHCMSFVKVEPKYKSYCLKEAELEAAKLNLCLDQTFLKKHSFVIPQDKHCDLSDEANGEILSDQKQNKDLLEMLPNLVDFK